MNSRIALLILLALVSVGAIADRPNLDSYSDSELWDSADLIALVRIESGAYIENFGFDVIAKPLAILKGDSTDSIGVSTHYSLLDARSQPGFSYLLFLIESGAGQFRLINEVRAAVPIIHVDIDDSMGIRMNAPRKSDRREWYSYDGSLWVVDCRSVQDNSDREYVCSRERSIVEYVMNRLGGVKGE